MKYFRIILAIFLIIIGMFSAFGIWFPGLRGIWGRRGEPKPYRDRVPLGAVSCVGFALLFNSIGLAFLWGDAIPKPFAIGVVVCIFCGCFSILGGLLLDALAHDRSRGVYRLPHETRMETPDEQQRWIFVAVAVSILLMMVLLLVFHKYVA